MNRSLAPSIFEAFNAKFLTPEEVAASFIAPDYFYKLCQPCHSIVLGPRGSGKTSLLKMLQRRALRAWKGQMAETVRKKINFIGVFVPTDILWQEQLKNIGKNLLTSHEQEALTDTTITLHVAQAFVSAVLDEFILVSVRSPRETGKIGAKKEKELVALLSDIFKVEPVIPTFTGLQMALDKKLMSIGFFVAKERLREAEGRGERLIDEGLIYPDFLTVLSPAIRAVNDLVGASDQYWALCFDELELAPDFLQTKLLRYLRSTQPLLYFKLSMSPFVKVEVEIEQSATRPQEDDDFNLIPLWYSDRSRSKRFSLDLATEFLRNANIRNVDPPSFFGQSNFGDELATESYAPGSFHHREIVSLRQKDPSFRKYLNDNKVDVTSMHKLSEDVRASVIRKAFPTILFRNYFLKPPDNRQQHRSRKSFELYAGWDSIAAICEGNPRWLKGLLSDMVGKVPAGAMRISASIQGRAINNTLHKFRSKLMTIPITPSGHDRGVLRLLDIIGGYFEEEVLGSEFKAEPVQSFRLDEYSAGISSEAIGAALNAGALVYVAQDPNKMILNNLNERRFRLCYMLATLHKIPLRLGGYISLSKILSNRRAAYQKLLFEDVVYED